jgi:cobalt-zinc-cadmium efflux system protein
VRADLEQLLDERHGVHHTTLQVDHACNGDSERDQPALAPHCEEPHGPIHRSGDTY